MAGSARLSRSLDRSMLSPRKRARGGGRSPMLSAEIAAYERMQAELELDHFGKWAVVR